MPLKPIELKLDRADAKAGIDAHIGDVGRADAVTKQLGSTFRKVMQDQLDATKAVEQAKTSTVQAQARQRDAAERSVAANQKARDAQAQAGLKATGEAGAAAFGKISVTAGDVQNGLRKALDLVVMFGEACQRAADNYRKMTGNFVDQRDKLGELAGIMGVQADNKFTLENSAFNKQAGLTPAEGLQFRLGFQNSGQQFKDSRLAPGEFTQYEQQAAQLAAARNIDPNIVGDLAGTLAGTKDRRGLGANGSEDALGKLNSGLAILGAGKGDNAVLGRQFNMTASAMLNEDAMKGTFQDSDEVAEAVSVMAEKNAAGASEMIRAAVKGLRDFNGKASGLLKRAGIDAKTKMIDGIKQLAPVVEKEARDKGVSVQDVLNSYFEDDLTAEAISVGINQGVGAGVFTNREKAARENQGAAAAQKVIADAGKGERIRNRQADAGVVLAENERGAANSRIDLLRKQAIEEMTREGHLGTTASFWEELLGRSLSLGAFSPRENRIEERQGAILQRRARQAGVSIDLLPSSHIKTPESMNEVFNTAMNQITTAKGDPTMDLPVGMQNGKVVPLLEEQNKLLQRVVDGINRPGNGPGQPTPVPPSIVRTGMPRYDSRGNTLP